MKFRFTALALLLAAVAANGETTLKDGVYTKAQAEKGKQTYDQFCKSCHLADFYEEKLQGWSQTSLSEFYDLVASTMPGDNPGGLYPEQYTEALAHIFYLLGYPAGENELNPHDGSMDEILIVTD